MLGILRPVWAYRGFIVSSVKREFQLKYRNSMLGAAWAVLQPLSMILVYTIIFSQIMRARLPGVESSFGYSIYLCAGVLSWGLFTEITSRSVNMFLDNANLLKKLSFPRLCLPVTLVSTALVNFAIIFALFFLFLVLSGNFPGAAIIALLPVMLLLVAMATGLGMVLGVLNVFFRDVGQFFNMVITFWFWLTPIVYPINILPERLQPLMAINPVGAIMAAMQGILVQGQWPAWSSLIYPLILTIILCTLGMRLFRRHSGDMVDEL